MLTVTCDVSWQPVTYKQLTVKRVADLVLASGGIVDLDLWKSVF